MHQMTFLLDLQYLGQRHCALELYMCRLFTRASSKVSRTHSCMDMIKLMTALCTTQDRTCLGKFDTTFHYDTYPASFEHSHATREAHDALSLFSSSNPVKLHCSSSIPRHYVSSQPRPGWQWRTSCRRAFSRPPSHIPTPPPQGRRRRGNKCTRDHAFGALPHGSIPYR